MKKEIENILALASELLTLARLDGGVAPPEFMFIDLSALVEKIVADAVYEQPNRRSDIALSTADESRASSRFTVVRFAQRMPCPMVLFGRAAGTALNDGDYLMKSLSTRSP